MSGGGGTSGAVDFPDHMKTVHKDWLGFTGEGGDTSVAVSLIDSLNNALGTGGNPFENVTLTDPETVLGEIETRYGTFDTAVSGLDESTDWQGFVDDVVSKLDTAGVLSDIDVATIISNARSKADLEVSAAVSSALEVIQDVVVRSAVRSFERRADTARLRSVNRFSGGMSDINAVHSSSYMLGMALIEAQHLQNVDEFDAGLTNDLYQGAFSSHVELYKTNFTIELQEAMQEKKIRDTLMAQSAQALMSSLFQRVGLEQASTETLAEVKTLRMAAVQEYELSNVDIDAKFGMWDFEVYGKSSNVLASISGASAALPEKPSRVSSILGGVLRGGAAGAPLGPVGAGVGAVLGGVAGAFS